jgi:hypothetical protein
VLLGEHLDIDCAQDPCPEGAECDDLLRNLDFGTLKTEMKRCRQPDQKVAGVLAGDLLLMSGKVNVFIPGSGFDHDSYIRSVFDSGGDIFSNPLSLDYVAAVGDDISYVYFEQRGKIMIPVFAESFTVSMSNKYACPRNDVDCMKGKELRYRRLVSVGGGDVASALAGYYKHHGIETGEVAGHVIDRRTNRPVSHTNVFALRLPKDWQEASDAEISQRSYDELASANRAETRSDDDPLGQVGVVSHFRTDTGLDIRQDGSFAQAGRQLRWPASTGPLRAGDARPEAPRLSAGTDSGQRRIDHSGLAVCRRAWNARLHRARQHRALAAEQADDRSLLRRVRAR